MAEKVEIDIEVTSNVEQSIAGLKALKKQLRETAAGSAEFKRIANEIDDLEDKLKGAKAGAADWIDTLESAGGPIGALGGALNKAKVATVSFGTALKATGIGLIVAAVGGLVAAFSNVEGAGKKLEPLLIGFEKILGGIFTALEPLIDSFVELATAALPYITKGIGIFYSTLVGLFNLVKNVGVGVGQILKGIFTLDFDTVSAGYDKIKNAIPDALDAGKAAFGRYEEGTKQLTKTEKENLKQRSEANNKAEDERKKRLAQTLKDLEFAEKLSESELEKQKELALGLAQTEQEKLDIETAFAKKRYDLQKKQLDDKKALLDPKKDKEEYQATLLALSDLDTNRVKELNDFNDQQKKINEDNLKAQKDFENKKKEILAAATKDEIKRALEERRVKYERDLQDLEKDKEFIKKSEAEKAELRAALKQAFENDTRKIENDAQLKKIDDELKLVGYRNETLLAGTKAYFDGRRELIDLSEQKELAQLDLTEKEKTAIREKYAKQRKDIDKDELASFGATISATLDSVANLGNALASSYDEEAKTSKKAFEERKKLQIATALISAASGIIQILTQPSTLPSPFDWIVKGVNAAALAVATGVQISNIKKTQFSSGKGQSTSVASSPPPTYTGAPSALNVPQVQATQGVNPSSQIAQTIGASQTPIRAYVVSQDISSQQALDRRTNVAATFSGG